MKKQATANSLGSRGSRNAQALRDSVNNRRPGGAPQAINNDLRQVDEASYRKEQGAPKSSR